jgi:hypothetical protein
MRFAHHVYAALAILVLGMSACEEASSLALTHTVGPEGATLSLPGGASLVIPPGALESDVTLGMAVVADLEAAGYAAPPAFIDGPPAVAVALTPHGTIFRTPVTLSLPYSVPATDLVIARLDDAEDTTWDAVGPVAVRDGLASVAISTFSTYALATVAAGHCPCWTGAVVQTFHARGALALNEGARRGWQDSARTDPPLDMGGGEGYPGSTSRYAQGVYFRQSGNAHTYLAEMSVSARAYDSGTWPTERHCTASTNGILNPFELWFPELEVTPNTSRMTTFEVDEGQFEACRALLRAAERGETGREIGLRVVGLPEGASLTVSHAGTEILLGRNGEVVFSPNITPQGEPYAVILARQPQGAECVLPANAEGTVESANVLIEIACTPTCGGPDGDGDGVPDACDAHPGTACERFSAADVEALAAMNGALCVTDATGDSIPVQIRSDSDSFSGVFIDLGGMTATAWEVIGVIRKGDEYIVARGCLQDGNTLCEDAGRPALPADSAATPEQYEACKDVVAHACE